MKNESFFRVRAHVPYYVKPAESKKQFPRIGCPAVLVDYSALYIRR